jgi:outer membrane biosynthesis protein TonB
MPLALETNPRRASRFLAMKTLPRIAGLGLVGLALAATAFAVTVRPEQERPAPPGVVHYVPPEFPLLARADGMCRGAAKIAVSWDERGVPTDAVAVSASEPTFAEAACAAAMQWRFAPERQPGRYYDFQFELSGVVVCQTKGANAIAAEARTDNVMRLATRSELDASPKAIVQPMPEMAGLPAGTLDAGRVVVDFIVDQDGRVRVPKVTEATTPELIEPTLAKLREWRFEAPRRNGRPAVFAESWAFQFRRAG